MDHNIAFNVTFDYFLWHWLRLIARAIQEERFSFKTGKTRRWRGRDILVSPLLDAKNIQVGYVIEIYDVYPNGYVGRILYNREKNTCAYEGYIVDFFNEI